MILSRKTIVLIVAILVGIFIIYLTTLPNTNTGYADADEMMTAAKVFGVVHPPGYPIYTMLGALFGRLPLLGLSFAGKVNVLNTVLHTVGLGFFFVSSLLILTSLTKNRFLAITASLVGLFSLAFSSSYWLYGLISEVFSLENFFVLLITMLLLLWWKRRSNRLLLLIAVCAGLGLANQQAILLMYPIFFIWVAMIDKKVFTNWKLIGAGILLGVIAFLLPYSYLLIASRFDPPINWEDPQGIYELYRVITRRIFAESSPIQSAYLEPRFNLTYIPRGFIQFGHFLNSELTIPLIILSLIGFGFLLIKKKYFLAIFLFGGVLGGGLFFANYSAFPLKPGENYYFPHLGIYQRFLMIAPIFLSFAISIGAFGTVIFLHEQISPALKKFKKITSEKLTIILAASLFIFPLILGIQNYYQLKNNYFQAGHDYGTALLDSLDKDAIVLCFTEHSCFTGTYLQYVEHKRPDVVILQVGFSQMSLEQFDRMYPGLISTTVPRFTLNHAVLIVRDLIRSNIDKRPIYIAGISNNPGVLSAHGILGDPFFLVPNGCALKVEKDFKVEPLNPICDQLNAKYSEKYFASNLAITKKFPAYLSYQEYLNAYLYLNNGCTKRASEELAKALKINPDFTAAQDAYRFIQTSLDKDQCVEGTKGPTAEEVLKQADEAEAKGTKDATLDALYYVNQAVSLSPKDINLHLRMAKLYLKANAPNNAFFEYQDVLKLDPTNQEAKKGLEQIPSPY